MANPNIIAPQGSELVGYSGTVTVAGTNLIPQIATDLAVYDDKSYPFMSIHSKLGMIEDAHNPTYQWQEIQFDEPNVNCESAISSGSANTTFSATIDTLAAVVGDQFCEATTNQLFEIYTVDSQDTTNITSTCTFIKVPNTSAISAVGANSFFIRLGNSMLEGGRYPEAIVRTPARLSNTITQVADQVRITKLMEQFWTYYGPQFQLDTRSMQERLKRTIERRTIWGQQYEQVQSQTHDGSAVSGMARGSRGVWNSITKKRIPYTPPLDEATLDAVCSDTVFGDVFGGGDVKFAFSGNSIYKDVASFVKNKFRKLDSVPVYGLQIHEYVSPVGNGSLYFTEERHFFNNPTYKNAMMIVDPSNIRVMKVGPTVMTVSNSSPPDRSVKSIAVEAWFGTKVMYDRSHTIVSPYV